MHYYDHVLYTDEKTESERMEIIYPSVKSNQGMELRNEYSQSDVRTNCSEQCISAIKDNRAPDSHYSCAYTQTMFPDYEQIISL